MLKVCIQYLTKEQCEHKISLFPNVEFSFNKEDIYKSDISFGGPSIEELPKCQNLKWVQTLSTGVDYYLDNNFPKHIMLTSANGAYGVAIAEHIMSMHLMLAKKLNTFYTNQKTCTWQNIGVLKNVCNSTVLVIGLGDIGTKYAKLVKAFGATVIGVKRNTAVKPEYLDELYTHNDLEKVLPRADVAVICTPLTSLTSNMINEKSLSLMKTGVILINIARGRIIDTEALCKALDTGKVGAAGLDVTQPEPLPENHKLWGYDNVIITPHISGNFKSSITSQAIIDIIFENLKRFINEEELINVCSVDSV